jgi:glycosyltransferase involved in cell wall biosynthesis
LRVVAVIPAFNEAASIGRVVAATLPYVEQVVVVDDGSRDETARLAAEAGAHVLVQPQNKGKGAALQRGGDYAVESGFDAIVALDADGQHDPRSIPALIEPLAHGQADMSVGSRKLQWSTHMPWIRRMTNAFMSALLSRVAGQPMEDTQSGYRCISVPVLRDVRVAASHFEAESEFLLKAARAGWRIAWVPIKAIYGDDVRPSHIRPVRDTIRFLRMLARVLREHRAPLKRAG